MQNTKKSQRIAHFIFQEGLIDLKREEEEGRCGMCKKVVFLIKNVPARSKKATKFDPLMA